MSNTRVILISICPYLWFSKGEKRNCFSAPSHFILLCSVARSCAESSVDLCYNSWSGRNMNFFFAKGSWLAWSWSRSWIDDNSLMYWFSVLTDSRIATLLPRHLPTPASLSFTFQAPGREIGLLHHIFSYLGLSRYMHEPIYYYSIFSHTTGSGPQWRFWLWWRPGRTVSPTHPQPFNHHHTLDCYAKTIFLKTIYIYI